MLQVGVGAKLAEFVPARDDIPMISQLFPSYPHQPCAALVNFDSRCIYSSFTDISNTSSGVHRPTAFLPHRLMTHNMTVYDTFLYMNTFKNMHTTRFALSTDKFSQKFSLVLVYRGRGARLCPCPPVLRYCLCVQLSRCHASH